MQGASVVVAVAVVLAQYPQQWNWLVPFFVLFFLLLLVAHRRYPPEFSPQIDPPNDGGVTLRLSLRNLLNRWVLPGLALASIVVAAMLTVLGIGNSIAGHFAGTNPQSWSEVIFHLTDRDEEQSIYLRTIIDDKVKSDLLARFEPVIHIAAYADPTNPSDYTIKFVKGTVEFEDSGVDPENRIVEPIGSFVTAGYNAASYPLNISHTYFFKLDTGIVRMHIVNLPTGYKTGVISLHVHLYLSYISFDSQKEPRFKDLLGTDIHFE